MNNLENTNDWKIFHYGLVVIIYNFLNELIENIRKWLIMNNLENTNDWKNFHFV